LGLASPRQKKGQVSLIRFEGRPRSSVGKIEHKKEKVEVSEKDFLHGEN
jgi:hypothetical protein